jgi:hypothetical protein
VPENMIACVSGLLLFSLLIVLVDEARVEQVASSGR